MQTFDISNSRKFIDSSTTLSFLGNFVTQELTILCYD